MPSSTDRKALRVEDKLAAGNFADDDVKALLEAMDVDTLIGTLGEPERSTRYARLGPWKEGDGRPALADNDPAVMQAIGRCAAHKTRDKLPIDFSAGHSTACAWCDYPLEQLVLACSWATAMSGYVLADLLRWKSGMGYTYVRETGLSGTYRNRVWKDFFDLPMAERAKRIEAAAHPEGIAA